MNAKLVFNRKLLIKGEEGFIPIFKTLAKY